MSTNKVVGNFGRLWARGYECLGPELRRIFSVQGPGATSYLQGMVTSDLSSAPPMPSPEPIGQAEPGVPKEYQSTPDLTDADYGQVTFDEQLRATCFLDNKGRIVTDSLLWKVNEEQYYIDVPTSAADNLLAHLKQYKLRRTKVEISDQTNVLKQHVIFGTLNADDPPPPPGIWARMDPRHPSLGMRVLENPSQLPEGVGDFGKVMQSAFPHSPGNYEFVRRLAGVAEGAELAGQVASQANQDFLNAVSFHKGCYLGQELTARVQHTGAIRKRILPLLLLGKDYQVPKQWKIAADLQRKIAQGKFTAAELDRLPPRQPRISVASAGHFVLRATGGLIDPTSVQGSSAERDYKAAQDLIQTLQEVAVPGAKIVDTKTDQTICKILTPPLPGTNLVTALCRLDSLGLQTPVGGGTTEVWNYHNKVRISDDSSRIFRYLPYLPLWWPELDIESGKALELSEDERLDRELAYKKAAAYGESYMPADSVHRGQTLEQELSVGESGVGEVDDDGQPLTVGLMAMGGMGKFKDKATMQEEEKQRQQILQERAHALEQEMQQTQSIKPTNKQEWFQNQQIDNDDDNNNNKKER